MVPYWGRITGTILMTAFYGWLLQSVSEDLFIGIAIGISPLLPIMWMSFYVLEVNDDEHYWWRYRWILGFKFGTKQSYRKIDYIALREKVITTRRNGEVIRYEGIVVFDDASECPLTRRKDQRFMHEKMK